MSYFLQINDDFHDQLASNKGYGDLGEWIDSLQHADYPQLSHLWEFGWCQKPDALKKEIDAALKDSPPKQASIKETAQGLATMLDEYGDGMQVVTVTDGISNATDNKSIEENDPAKRLIDAGYSEAEAKQKIVEERNRSSEL